MIKEIKNELLNLKEDKYKKFSSSLLPGVKNILGIRLPILKKTAKKIYKEGKIEEFISQNTDEFYELTMLEAMCVGLIKDYSQAIKHIENFIEKINNWGVCDTFCCGLKTVKENKEEFKNFLEKYFNSNDEFKLRFAYVILLNYYIESDFNYTLEKIKKFNNDSYYSKMAASWLLSICFIKKFDETFDFIKKNKIHNFVLRKGITKARESFRLNKEQKEILKNFISNFSN